MKIKRKIIATIMLTIILSSNLLNLGAQVIATSKKLENQNSKTNVANVEFSSYLEEEKYEKTYEVSETGKLYVKLLIKENGYLKNGIVDIINANFNIDSSRIENNYIQKIENNTIYLSQIQSDEEVLIELPITFKKSAQIDSNYFEKEVKVEFKANYVDGNGKERKVEKVVINKINWKANPEIEIIGEVNKYIPYHEGEEYGLLVQSKINTGIKENLVPIKSTTLEIKVPTINGANPERVTVIANSTKGTNGKENGNNFGKENYEYIKEEGKVEIKTTNDEQEEKIVWGEGKDEYIITYIYTGEEVYNYAQEQVKQVEQGNTEKQGKIEQIAQRAERNRYTVKAEEVQKQIEAIENEKAIKGEIEVTGKIEVYNAEQAKLEVEGKLPYTIEKTGNLVDLEAIEKTEISKANIYANYDKKEGKQETTYDVTYGMNIYDVNINKEVEYEVTSDKIEYKEEKYTAGNNIYVREVKVPEEEFLKILGEEGKVEVLKKDGTLVGAITKESSKDENGNYIINIVEEINKEDENTLEGQEVNTKENKKEVLSELIIKTGKPIAEGKIEITITKEISTEHNYTKEEMKEITAIEVETLAKSGADTKTLTNKIELQEVTNKAEVNLQAESLSTVVINKDVQIRAILDTSSLENALYKNPTIRIKLPAYISNINIKSADILMENGLKIKNVKGDSENESPVIVVELEGTQTDYTIGAEYKGTIIILNTDITVKTLTPTNESKIEMTYVNENEVVKEKEGKVEAKVNFVAPTGVVTANAIANYANNKKALMTISAETLKAELDTYKEKKEATVTGTIVNNYGNKISNIKILGRVPSKENKGIEGEKVESTFDAKIVTEIKVTGLENYKVYYSSKADATENLEDANNSWEEKYTKEAKSYLIVVDESYEMEEHKTIEFNYNIEIPANLSYNNNSYEMYKVYYTNVSEVGKIGEEKDSPVLQLSTGEGPELDVRLQPTVETIKFGQTVRMEVTVTNTGDITVTNAKVNITKPEYAEILEYEANYGFYENSVKSKEIKLGTIKPEETAKATYYIKIDEQIENEDNKITDYYIDENGQKYYLDEEGNKIIISDEEKIIELISKVTVTVDQIEDEIPSNEYKTTIQKGGVAIQLLRSGSEENPLLVGQTEKIILNVNKVLGINDLENVTIKVPLLENFIYKNATIQLEDAKTTEGITYNKDTNTVEIQINKLTAKSQTISITVEVKSNTEKGTIMAIAETEEGEKYYSNTINYSSEPVVLNVSELKSTPKYVKERERVTYQLTITNEGKTSVQNIKIEDILPEDLMFVEAAYTYINANYEEALNKIYKAPNNVVEINLATLTAGETTTITIVAKAKALSEGTEKQVQNKVKISTNYFETVETNVVTNIIEYNEEIHKNEKPNDPSDPSTSRYKITGTAWLDENKNGKREEDEKRLANIQVILLNKANNSIVADVDTRAEKRTTTSGNGTYTFTNIPKGQYLVLFLYDSASYSLTTYQAKEVEEDVNSDAIDINVVFDGERRLAGITNTVAVTSSNVRDIDIGLYEAEKFDLRIDKYISKVTLTTPTIGTRTTNYDNLQLAKVEILAKNVNKSSIIVEYKIKVTNEGKVAGYAKKLIDYLPEDANFSSEINNDWYLSDNNQNVYNTSLANTVIEPGESKEVSLILSFNITDKNIGNIINNNAEIYESYNEQGIEDIDSIGGNKASDEDDISKADIILSVVTGKIVVGAILILAILAILIFGIIEIRKKVLIKKEN